PLSSATFLLSTFLLFFFFPYPATPQLYTLSLHDALPILAAVHLFAVSLVVVDGSAAELEALALFAERCAFGLDVDERESRTVAEDRKSTRLNSSHLGISYAVFCLKKKKQRN